eukprot:509287-Lingulodinium_polyedra.AAC.1
MRRVLRPSSPGGSAARRPSASKQPRDSMTCSRSQLPMLKAAKAPSQRVAPPPSARASAPGW